MDQVHGPNFSPGVQINPPPPSSAVPEPTDWVSHSVPVMHINSTFCFKGALLCLHLHAKHPRWKHLKPRSWQADVWPQDSGHRAAGKHSPANLCSLCLTEPAPPAHNSATPTWTDTLDLCHTDPSQWSWYATSRMQEKVSETTLIKAVII